jgi:acetyltransferase-like isoleucine patch superfamily enzyme
MFPTSKFAKLRALPWLEKTQRVSEFYWSLKTRLYYQLFWGHIGKKSKLIRPMRLRNVRNIYIGDNVLINHYAFLLTLQEDAAVVPRLTIGDGSVIGHMNHITCIREVEIGENVLTADRVYISDHSHNFSNTQVPIMHQGVVSKGTVSIGAGTWIGENVVILSCKIGRNCVIGSNAVVLRDVPDFCVAVGIPAQVVQRFNPSSRMWERVERQQ